MKRNIGLLLCCVFAAAMLFSGCTARNNKDTALSADDIVGMLGKDYNGFTDTIGIRDGEKEMRRGSRYTYNRSVLGEDSNISLLMGDDSRIQKVVVYTDIDRIDDWRAAFSDKYGLSYHDSWRDDDTRVQIIDSGGTAVISIEKQA